MPDPTEPKIITHSADGERIAADNGDGTYSWVNASEDATGLRRPTMPEMTPMTDDLYHDAANLLRIVDFNPGPELDAETELRNYVGMLKSFLSDKELVRQIVVVEGIFEEVDDFTPCCEDHQFGPYHTPDCPGIIRPHYRQVLDG